MNKEMKEPASNDSLAPFMTYTNAAEILSEMTRGHKVYIDPARQQALELAIRTLHMVENAHHAVSDSRD